MRPEKSQSVVVDEKKSFLVEVVMAFGVRFESWISTFFISFISLAFVERSDCFSVARARALRLFIVCVCGLMEVDSYIQGVTTSHDRRQGQWAGIGGG